MSLSATTRPCDGMDVPARTFGSGAWPEVADKIKEGLGGKTPFGR